ncbi:MAG: GTP-binding protein [Chloroflexota bacterium]
MMLSSGSIGQAYFNLAGRWWASEPRQNWPDDAELQLELKDVWMEPYGDRRQELVCIGQNVDKEQLVSALTHSLLTESEMSDWQTGRMTYNNPFLNPEGENDAISEIQ